MTTDPLTREEKMEHFKLLQESASHGLKTSALLNGGGALALLTIFSGQSDGILRQALVPPLVILAISTALVLLATAARFYADSLMVYRMIRDDDRYARQSWLWWFLFTASHVLALASGIGFIAALVCAIDAFGAMP